MDSQILYLIIGVLVGAIAIYFFIKKMRIKIYSRAISFTSIMLNACIKAQWWKIAESLTKFRKNHLALPMRKLMN